MISTLRLTDMRCIVEMGLARGDQNMRLEPEME